MSYYDSYAAAYGSDERGFEVIQKMLFSPVGLAVGAAVLIGGYFLLKKGKK